MSVRAGSYLIQWPVVRTVAQFKPRHSDNQIRAKRYKGGWIQIKGANSPKEFRRVTSDDVFLEECDGYPWASKEEGDPARLAYKRNLTSPRRFSAAGSTPKVKGFSRIDAMFEQGSQEYRYAPAPIAATCRRWFSATAQALASGGHRRKIRPALGISARTAAKFPRLRSLGWMRMAGC